MRAVPFCYRPAGDYQGQDVGLGRQDPAVCGAGVRVDGPCVRVGRAQQFREPSVRLCAEPKALTALRPPFGRRWVDQVDEDGRPAAMSYTSPEGFDGHLLYVREDVVKAYAGDRTVVTFGWGERHIHTMWPAEIPERLRGVYRAYRNNWRIHRIVAEGRREGEPRRVAWKARTEPSSCCQVAGGPRSNAVMEREGRRPGFATPLRLSAGRVPSYLVIVLGPIIAPSALKHGLGEDEILHAYRNPVRVWDLGDGFIMIVGPKPGGDLPRGRLCRG